MLELREQINDAMEEFNSEAEKAENGNQAAARRARVASMKLRKLFKSWKEASLNQGEK